MEKFSGESAVISLLQGDPRALFILGFRRIEACVVGLSYEDISLLPRGSPTPNTLCGGASQKTELFRNKLACETKAGNAVNAGQTFFE